MTVKELIAVLRQMNPNEEVWLQKDTEGNGFEPVRGVSNNCAYDKSQVRHDGSVDFMGLAELSPDLVDVGYTIEDVVSGGVICVVLSP